MAKSPSTICSIFHVDFEIVIMSHVEFKRGNLPCHYNTFARLSKLHVACLSRNGRVPLSLHPPLPSWLAGPGATKKRKNHADIFLLTIPFISMALLSIKKQDNHNRPGLK